MNLSLDEVSKILSMHFLSDDIKDLVMRNVKSSAVIAFACQKFDMHFDQVLNVMQIYAKEKKLDTFFQEYCLDFYTFSLNSKTTMDFKVFSTPFDYSKLLNPLLLRTFVLVMGVIRMTESTHMKNVSVEYTPLPYDTANVKLPQRLETVTLVRSIRKYRYVAFNGSRMLEYLAVYCPGPVIVKLWSLLSMNIPGNKASRTKIDGKMVLIHKPDAYHKNPRCEKFDEQKFLHTAAAVNQTLGSTGGIYHFAASAALLGVPVQESVEKFLGIVHVMYDILIAYGEKPVVFEDFSGMERLGEAFKSMGKTITFVTYTSSKYYESIAASAVKDEIRVRFKPTFPASSKRDNPDNIKMVRKKIVESIAGQGVLLLPLDIVNYAIVKELNLEMVSSASIMWNYLVVTSSTTKPVKTYTLLEVFRMQQKAAITRLNPGIFKPYVMPFTFSLLPVVKKVDVKFGFTFDPEEVDKNYEESEALNQAEDLKLDDRLINNKDDDQVDQQERIYPAQIPAQNQHQLKQQPQQAVQQVNTNNKPSKQKAKKVVSSSSDDVSEEDDMNDAMSSFLASANKKQ